MAVTCVLVLAPSAAEANMVLPLCILAWPIMVWSLIPVIALETLVLWLRVGLPLPTAAWLVAEANLASTVLGLPVVAVVLTMIPGLAGRSAIGRRKPVAEIMRLAWGSVGENRDDPVWASMAAWLAVLFPFFVASWTVEQWVVVYLMGGRAVEGVWDALREANLLSYGLLAVTGLLAMAWHIRAARRTRGSTAELRARAAEDSPRLEVMPPDGGPVGGAWTAILTPPRLKSEAAPGPLANGSVGANAIVIPIAHRVERAAARGPGDVNGRAVVSTESVPAAKGRARGDRDSQRW